MHKSKKKKGDVAYKIDLEKSYDHVDWSYLKSCLQDLGFPPIIVKLILHCVTSSLLSILWNGTRMPPFSPTRGFHQGDPLSSYLFVLCMEKLSLAINETVVERKSQPFKVCKEGPWVSHLFFEDDVLLFTKANGAQARLVANIFDNFSKVSGLKVNVAKSRAYYSSGVPKAKIEKCTSISQISSTLTLDKYLGFPIFKGRVKKDDFMFIIEKMQSRLASWKNHFLNKPRQLVLASSVLTFIPTYYMQTCWLPQSVCSLIDRSTVILFEKETRAKVFTW